LGVGTVNEKLNLFKKQSDPRTYVPLLEGHQVDPEQLKSVLKHTNLKQMVSSTSIQYKFTQEEMEQSEILGLTPALVEKSPFCIKMVLNRNMLLENNMTTVRLKAILKSYINAMNIQHQKIKKRTARDIFKNMENIQILSTTDVSDQSCLYILFSIVIEPVDYQWLIRTKNKILEEVITEGYTNIRDVYINNVTNVVFKDKKPTLVKKTELILYGINLKDIRDLKCIDLNNIRCNNILKIYRTFGIEAARMALIEEIFRIFDSNGAGVNYHHISLLADAMCFHGFLVGCTRHGINKLDTSILARASFEDTIPTFVNAAVFSEHDPMKSVSANVMFGKIGRTGTGICDLNIDIEKILNTTTDFNQHQVESDNLINSNIIDDIFNNKIESGFTPSMLKV
jgi:DNA-directed RNA polymerase beta' subunit